MSNYGAIGPEDFPLEVIEQKGAVMAEEVNEPLANIVYVGAPPAVTYALLIERDEMILDHLRMTAAQMGLLPSVTAMVLGGCGLGRPIEKDRWSLLQTQAKAEMEELARSFRELNGEQ